jgi:hypothetical protein
MDIMDDFLDAALVIVIAMLGLHLYVLGLYLSRMAKAMERVALSLERSQGRAPWRSEHYGSEG